MIKCKAQQKMLTRQSGPNFVYIKKCMHNFSRLNAYLLNRCSQRSNYAVLLRWFKVSI